MMTGFMLGMTITTMANYKLHDLPAKWWLICISSTAVGAGIWAVRAGPTYSIRFWCGLLWAIYAAIRSASWLGRGSWSGALAWLPCLLLGVVVFARRSSPPHAGRQDEQPT